MGLMSVIFPLNPVQVLDDLDFGEQFQPDCRTSGEATILDSVTARAAISSPPVPATAEAGLVGQPASPGGRLAARAAGLPGRQPGRASARRAAGWPRERQAGGRLAARAPGGRQAGRASARLAARAARTRRAGGLTDRPAAARGGRRHRATVFCSAAGPALRWNWQRRTWSGPVRDGGPELAAKAPLSRKGPPSTRY